MGASPGDRNRSNPATENARRQWLPLIPDLHLPLIVRVALVLCGMTAGYASGLLGIGGWISIVPILRLGFGIPLRIAIGTRSLPLLISSLFSTRQHAYPGHVDLRGVLARLCDGVQSRDVMFLGARHGHPLPLRLLRRTFAFLMFGVIALLAVNLLIDLI